MAGARRQVDDGKGGQSLSVAIRGLRILLVNKLFVFSNNGTQRGIPVEYYIDHFIERPQKRNRL